MCAEPVLNGNARNGATPKTLTTEQGDVAIETPRDRNGSDDKILSMCARGMAVRDRRDRDGLSPTRPDLRWADGITQKLFLSKQLRVRVAERVHDGAFVEFALDAESSLAPHAFA